MAVKANLGGGLTEIVVKIVIFIAGAIKITKEFIVFIGYKAFKLEVFRVTIAKRVGKSVKVVR